MTSPLDAGRSAVPALLRELNERTVLDAIWAGAPISRAEVARRAGLSKPTVSLALQSLVESGLVRAAGAESGRPGRAGVLFEPAPSAAFVLAVDIGARFVRGAVADLAGEIRAREDVAVSDVAVEPVLTVVSSLADRLSAAAGVDAQRVVIAVVGAPGVVDPTTGELSLAGNIPGLDGLRLAAVLTERLGVEVAAENDVNLAALGEQARGHGREVADFAVVSIGTGLGAGLVLGGELHRGTRGMAGEIDDIPLGVVAPAPEDIDPSAVGIAVLAARLAPDHPASSLAPPYEARAVFAAAAEDPLAEAIVRRTARSAALFVASIVAVVDVGLVVLAGGIGTNPVLLAAVREETSSLMATPPRVEASQLGDGAVLAGALAVGRRRALDLVFERRSSREAIA